MKATDGAKSHALGSRCHALLLVPSGCPRGSVLTLISQPWVQGAGFLAPPLCVGGAHFVDQPQEPPQHPQVPPPWCHLCITQQRLHPTHHKTKWQQEMFFCPH